MSKELREAMRLFASLSPENKKMCLLILRQAAEGKENNMEQEHNTQEMLNDDLWDTAQWMWQGNTNALLEFAADVTRKHIFRAWKDKPWPDGLNWNSRYAWLAYLVRVAYLKGYAEGYAGAGVELNADAAIAQTLAEDEFWEDYFEGEVEPGPAVKMLLKELDRLKNFDT